MKFLNIKIKITLWYTFFMVVLISTILGLVVEFTDITIFTNQKSQLVEVVEDVVEDIEDGDDFDFFDDGVFILVYNANGEYITGSLPTNFPLNLPLEAGKVKEIKDENEFYIYEQKVVDKSGKDYWIRGVVSDIHSNNLSKFVIMVSFIILPILVIVSSLIGYHITKKAFAPVRKIQETAENITQNNRLSLRIGLPNGKDEISMLGNTIDNMLEKLESSFIKEKQFTSDASHELRTPISVILAESEYILQHGESVDEAKESMEIIKRQAEKMSALINQLLFFTRVDQGNVQLKLENVDIPSILEEIREDNYLMAKKKNIEIEYINNLKRRKWQVDKIMFIRAIQNVVQNSIIYGKDGGFVQVESFDSDEYLAIKVRDNGIGISPENIEKIWNRFYQVDESRSNSSMGLGLSMVKIIIEKHCGYVEVESTLGDGTTFTLYFKKL